MKYCTHCGNELMDEAVVCTQCGCPTATGAQKYTPANADVVSPGLNILGFFIPIIGLIMFLVMFQKTPIKAKSIGLWTLAGWIIAIILWAIILSC